MFIDPYRFASLKTPVARGDQVVPRTGMKFLAILLIGSVATLGGSAAGAGIKALSADEPAVLVAAAAVPEPVQMEAEVVVTEDVSSPVKAAPATGVVVAAAPRPGVAPGVARAPGAAKAPAAVPPPAPAMAPGPVAPAAPGCSADQRMDDTKINWLLQQSAATLAENPSQAAGAARVDADLRGALGKNLCASEAQGLIASTCTDPKAVKFLNTMVNRLPFFIKPMVGNPCTANLVAVLNKMGKFIS